MIQQYHFLTFTIPKHTQKNLFERLCMFLFFAVLSTIDEIRNNTNAKLLTNGLRSCNIHNEKLSRGLKKKDKIRQHASMLLKREGIRMNSQKERNRTK